MDNKIYKVKNRSASVVAYVIPEINVRRQFAPGETKKISYEELEKLTYQPGGVSLIRNYLQIDDMEAAVELNDNRPLEPEYVLDEAGVKDLLINADMNTFLDALDFAPDGVKDLIKSLAISLPLNDVSKRDAIKKVLGFDVTAALANAAPDPDEAVAAAPARRRTEAAAAEDEAPKRRTESKYKVITPSENN